MNSTDTEDGSTESIENLQDLVRRQLTSRRAFLSKTAAMGVGTVALSGGARATTLSGDPTTATQAGMEMSDDLGPSTIDMINNVLVLEHLENTFYQQGLERFSATELRNADILCGLEPELVHELPTRLEAIAEHETAHVAAITAAIKGLGGTPVQAAEYEFGYETPSQFLQLAQMIENLVVSAFDGGIALVDINLLQTAAATIATVEARHASYLNTITTTNPFPTAFDAPETMDSVMARASQFITGANDDRQLFTVQVSAVSEPDTYLESVAVPLSPGVYAVHTDENPIFTPGKPADTPLERLAEDGSPKQAALTLAGETHVRESGDFASFVSLPRPAITPGQPATFSLTAAPGECLSFATMFVPSNDLFFAPDEAGIPLFETGKPVSGDVTSQIELWDAGTEQNQRGIGPDTKPNQPLVATDAGSEEDKSVRPISEVDDPNEYPGVSEVIKVTLMPV